MSDNGVLETVASCVWPAGPVLILAGAIAAVAWLRRREASDAALRVTGLWLGGRAGIWMRREASDAALRVTETLPAPFADFLRRHEASDPALRVFRVLALLSGSVVAYQAIRYGWPAVSWIAVGAVTIGFANALRPPDASLRREIITAMRNAVIAATAGVAIVVAMQVALAYQTEGHAERVLGWNRQLAAASDWLKHVVFLGPLKLGLLLAASIVMVVVATPALRLVPSYRRVANTATYTLLALTVATSFTFFAGQHAPGWQKEWIARQRNNVGSQMDELEQRNNETVTLLAINDALRTSSPAERTQFRMFVRFVDEHADREAIWEHVTRRWKNDAGLAPIVERVRRAQTQLEAPPTTPEARATAEALERLRRIRTTPEDVELADLEVLGVERSKAAAAHDEAKRGAYEVIGEILLGDSLTGQLLKTMLGCVKVESIHFRRSVDPRSVRTAMNAGTNGPPSVSFDFIGMPLTDAPEEVTASDMKTKVADLAHEIETERIAEQERKTREAEERRIQELQQEQERERDVERVPTIRVRPGGVRDPIETIRPPFEGHSMPTRPSIPPAHVVRPTRFGGGRFGGRRRDPNCPPPVRLVA